MVIEPSSLRKLAEEQLRMRAASRLDSPEPSKDLFRTVHELEVHQIELELQNEELILTQDALAKSLDKYFDLFELAPTSYYSLDFHGVIREANLAGAALLGIDRHVLLGQRIGGFVCESSRSGFSSFFARLPNSNGKQIVEIKLKPKSGECCLVQLEGFVSSQLGEEPTIRLAAIDITDRVKAEEERVNLEKCLLQTQKTEAIGRLAGGIAHDLNNMLSVITGFAEVSIQQTKSNENVQVHLREILNAANRSAELVKKLLTFASHQKVLPQRLNLNEEITSLKKILQQLSGPNIELSCDLAPTLGTIKMDPVQISQILINLVANARDAIAANGRTLIKTRNVTHCHQRLNGCSKEAHGDFVELLVADDGCGMDEHTLRHLYEPFFTTKAIGKGTGMGLASVYGIVGQCDGFISVTSAPGQGSSILILFPRCNP